MADDLRTPALSIRVLYEDPPDLIEVEAQVSVAGWSGAAKSYLGLSSLAEDARGLLAWIERPGGEFSLEAGVEGLGQFFLGWRVVDRAGHLACRVRLVAPARGHGIGDASLSVDFPAEAASIERFARQLVGLAESMSGEAVIEVA